MYFTIALFIIIIDFVFNVWLQFRQHRKFAITKVPEELVEFTTAENFLRSQNYGRDKRCILLCCFTLQHFIVNSFCACILCFAFFLWY
jgi:hypothetical protein